MNRHSNVIGNCLICDTLSPLVRDHDHVTGFIRGLLCRPCNSWLGVYEHKGTGKTAYREWVQRYEPKILEHLQRNTGKRMGRTRPLIYMAFRKEPFTS